jgi:hypothetical protein
MAVYIARIGEGGPVKIGCSGNTMQRVAALQKKQSEALVVIRVIEGAFAEERWLHRRYRDLRINGEWFHFDETMLTVAVEPDAETGPRLSMNVATDLYSDIQRVARETGTSMTTVIRMAFTLYKVCHEAKKAGQHVGLVSDPSRLDRELVGLI